MDKDFELQLFSSYWKGVKRGKRTCKGNVNKKLNQAKKIFETRNKKLTKSREERKKKRNDFSHLDLKPNTDNEELNDLLRFTNEQIAQPTLFYKRPIVKKRPKSAKDIRDIVMNTRDIKRPMTAENVNEFSARNNKVSRNIVKRYY